MKENAHSLKKINRYKRVPVIREVIHWDKDDLLVCTYLPPNETYMQMGDSLGTKNNWFALPSRKLLTKVFSSVPFINLNKFLEEISTAIPCFIALCIYCIIFYKLKVSGNRVEQAYWCHISKSIYSLHVSVSYFGSSHSVLNFFIIIFVTVICKQCLQLDESSDDG